MPASSDRFEKLDILGRGPLGEVLRARDRQLDRIVALRIIEEPDEARADALLTAARRATAIRHPNVVEVLDCGREGTTVWVARELVEGRTLACVLDEDGPFPAERLVTVGVALCAALEAGHRCGMVHHHLSPANVKLGPGGVKLMDFGLAHARDLVTLPYASPEVALGFSIDERSDLYSLGVLLAELATGAGFSHDDAADAPLVVGDQVPPALLAVLVRLLHKDRGARFRHAAAVAEALQASLRPAPPARRRRRRIVGAIVAVVGVDGLVALVRGRPGAAQSFFAGCSRQQ